MRSTIEELQRKINNMRQRQMNMSLLETKKAREIQRLIMDRADLEDDIMIAEYDLEKLKALQ